MIQKSGTFNTIRLAKVCYVYPEGHQFDGLFLDTGEYCRCVQMMSSYAGTDFGFASGIPAPETEGYDENRETDPDRRNVIAVVASIATGYIGLGFMFPQVNQLAFTKADKNRMIERHTSDVYRTIDDLGNMDIVHPNKSFIRIGLGPFPAILDGADYDARWAIKRNVFMPAGITIASPTTVTLAASEVVETSFAADAGVPTSFDDEPQIPAVDWIAENEQILSAIEEDDGDDEEEEEIRKKFRIFARCSASGFTLGGLKNRNNFRMFTDDPDGKPYFQFAVFGGSRLMIYRRRIDVYVGKSSGISVREDGIVMQVGETKLEITAEGIKTTGDIMTEGVHTDNNGTHV